MGVGVSGNWFNFSGIYKISFTVPPWGIRQTYLAGIHGRLMWRVLFIATILARPFCRSAMGDCTRGETPVEYVRVLNDHQSFIQATFSNATEMTRL